MERPLACRLEVAYMCAMSHPFLRSFAAILAIVVAGANVNLAADETPFCSSELVFPLETWHNHASCIVELPNRDLLVCWFHGSGERKADDVIIEGARLKRGARRWGARFTL